MSKIKKSENYIDRTGFFLSETGACHDSSPEIS